VDIVSAAPSRQTRTTVWLALLVLAALGWAVLIQQNGNMGSATQALPQMDGMSASNPAPVDMHPATTPILLYLPIWVAMMMAMMFPSVAPMVMHFVTLSRNRRAAGKPSTPTWVFLAGYLAVWSLVGVLAYLLSLALPAVSMVAPGLRIKYPLAAGLVLIFAGLYQLTPLKQVCLHHCRSPISIILSGWHDGNLGSFRMGLEHGVVCLGSSWGLMLVLFVAGLMNLVGMVILSAVIFVEKVVPHGPFIGKLTALALILFGLVTLLMPVLRPVTS
jgi:predicted metal-binding membrane protein